MYALSNVTWVFVTEGCWTLYHLTTFTFIQLWDQHRTSYSKSYNSGFNLNPPKVLNFEFNLNPPRRQTQADAAEPDEASSSHWQWRNSVNTKHAPLYHLTFIFVSFIYIDQVHCNHLTLDYLYRPTVII